LAEKLLAEYGEDMDIFKPTNIPEDVEMLTLGDEENLRISKRQNCGDRDGCSM
jgi:hypothetical protein